MNVPKVKTRIDALKVDEVRVKVDGTGAAVEPVKSLEEWYGKYDEFVYSKINAVLGKRFEFNTKGNPEARAIRERKDDLAEELHAAIWAHIVENFPQYRDQGLKHGPMAWIGTVATNFMLDYFEKIDNRQKLQPTKSLGANPEEEETSAYRYTDDLSQRQSGLPARAARPAGTDGSAQDENDPYSDS